jgi:hypothetical protein
MGTKNNAVHQCKTAKTASGKYVNFTGIHMITFAAFMFIPFPVQMHGL